MALFDQIIVSGTNFLTLILIANFCTQQEVGLFYLAWTVVGFSRTIQERLISAPYMVFVHDAKTTPGSFLGSSLIHQLIYALAVCALLLITATVFHAAGMISGLAGLFIVLIFSLPFMLLRDHIRAVCSANYEYPVIIIIDLVVCTIQIGGILALAFLDQLTIPGVAIVLGLACLAPTAIWLYLRYSTIEVSRQSITTDWKKNWDFSRWLVAARCFGMAGFYSVPWIVVAKIDETNAGIFAAATSLVGLSLMFIMGTNNFFQPRTVKARHELGATAMLHIVHQTILVWGIPLLALVVFFHFSGGWLLGVLYGSGYQDHGSVAFWLSLSILTVSPSIACGNGLSALTRPKMYLSGEICYCLVAIAGTWLLVPLWGLNGAGVALSLAGVTVSVVTYVLLSSLVKKSAQLSTASP